MLKLQKNRVACIPMFDPDMYGSIVIPDVAKERVDQGIVKYIGEEVTICSPGDHIIFSGYAGQLVDLEGEGLLIILSEEFITAKIESDSTDIRGLYFLGADGQYFTATYEMALNLIAKSLAEHPQFRNFKAFDIKSDLLSRPKPEKF